MPQKYRYPSIDGLKGLLIFLIVFHHVFPVFPAAGDGPRVLDSIPLTSFITIYGGDVGDSLFFMLSGFLMATGYRQKIMKREISFGPYLGKRLAKLYPMYILSNLVMLVMAVLQYGPSSINLKQIAFTALIQLGGGLQANPYNPPSWFLSTLFLCYVLYYFITHFSSHSTGYYCSILAGVLLGYTIQTVPWTLPFFNALAGMGVMSFFLGCILCEVYPLLRRKCNPWLPVFSVLVLGASFYLMMRYGVEIIAGDSKTAFSFVISPLVILTALESKLFSRFLQTKAVQFLGKISISVFFWHYPIIVIMRYVCNLIGTPLTEAMLPAYLVLLLLLCTLAFRLDQKRNTP